MKLIAKGIGVPEVLAADRSKAETNTEVKRFCTNIDTALKTLK